MRLELTILELQSSALAAWRRAREFIGRGLARIHANQKEYKNRLGIIVILIRVYLRLSAANFDFGTEGEIRTLEASLEDSHVSSYITSASHCRLRCS